MPDQTIDAARDHATVARTIDRDVEAAQRLIDAVRDAGVDFNHIVLHELVDEGVRSFADSYHSLIETIAKKARSLAGVR
jgi:transaldolase